MKGKFLVLCLLQSTIFYENVKCQRKISPCPSIFTYDSQNDAIDTWFGTLRLQSTVPLYGIHVDVIFDRKVDTFGADHFSQATTSNYIEFRVENNNFRLDPGRTLVMNIYVKYRDSVPILKQVRLNGQNVCTDLPVISAVQPIYSPVTSSSPYEYDLNNNKKPSTREIPNTGYESSYDTTTRRINNNNNSNRNAQPSTQAWYDDSNRNSNARHSTTSRSVINNNSGNINNNNNKQTFHQNSNVGRTTPRPYDQTRPSQDDRIYFDVTEKNTYDSQNSNKNTNFAFVGETLNNNQDNSRRPDTSQDNSRRPEINQDNSRRPNTNQDNLRPYDQTLSTTTKNHNSRTTSTTYRSIYTTKQNYFPGDLPFFNTETSTHSILNVDNDNECGSVIPKTNPLIIHGLETYPGNFPWHAAIYISEIGSLKYICGGSLISMSAILSAAHCVTRSKSKVAISSDDLLVYLGKHNLQKWTGQEQDGKIVDIIVHHEYDPDRFYSDIAILKSKEPFRRTNYVRPVCLWNFDSDLKQIVDKLGSVPGWGYNENGLVSEDLSYIKMPVVTHETCIWSNRDFFSKITSEKSFCAGFRNGTSICNGDSGGGMVFKQANKWYIRGVVSVSIALQNTLRCDPEHFSVFVDAAKYTNWVQQNM